jgi:hypothetical protein
VRNRIVIVTSFTSAALATVFLLWPVSAVAAPDDPILVTDPAKVTLTVDDAGKGAATITVINTASSKLNLDAAAAGTAKECVAEANHAVLQPHTQGAIKVTFKRCSSDTKTSGDFTVKGSVDGRPKTVYKGTFAATQDETSPEVEWGYLWWFAIAAGVSAFTLGSTWLAWAQLSRGIPAKRPPKAKKTKKERNGTGELKVAWGRVKHVAYLLFRQHLTPAEKEHEKKQKGRGFVGPFHPLPGLGSSWSFKESWASNATVIAAVFTGLFGATEVTKTILGDDSKAVLALVAVAVAASVGLAGIAPMLLQSWRRTWSGEVTPLGVMLASVVTLTATGGELGLIADVVYDTKTVAPEAVLGTGILGGVLLLFYAVAATLQNLETGIATEGADQPNDDINVSSITNQILDIALVRVPALHSDAALLHADLVENWKDQLPPDFIHEYRRVRQRTAAADSAEPVEPVEPRVVIGRPAPHRTAIL